MYLISAGLAGTMGLRQPVMLPHWRLRLIAVLPTALKRKITDWEKDTRTDMSWHSDINWVIMDYLVSEGYPGAAEKFAQETNLPGPVENESIWERVRVRTAIHSGKIKEAIQMVNEADPEVSMLSSFTPYLT